MIERTLEIKKRNYQLEALLGAPVPSAESEPYRRKCKPWQCRKKGRAGHGY